MSDSRIQLTLEGLQEGQKGLEEDAENSLFMRELQRFENMNVEDNQRPINNTCSGTSEPASVTEMELTREPTFRLEFLKLPMEIQLLIFTFMGPDRVSIQRVKKKNERGVTRYQLDHTALTPRNSKGQMMNLHVDLDARHSTNAMLCSRQFYKYLSLSVYENTQFVLRSIKALRRFLDTTSPDAQSQIRHIELFHEMHNNPMSDDEEYFDPDTLRSQFRSEASWRASCERMLRVCPNLRWLYHETVLSDRGARYLDLQDVNPGMFLSAGATVHIRHVIGTVHWVEETAVPKKRLKKLFHRLLQTAGQMKPEQKITTDADSTSLVWTAPNNCERIFTIKFRCPMVLS